MKTKKKIAWESWNAKVSEFLSQEDTPQEEMLSYEEQVEQSEKDPFMFTLPQSRVIYTPMGPYPEE